MIELLVRIVLLSRTIIPLSGKNENDPISYFNKSANREQAIPELRRERKRAIIYP